MKRYQHTYKASKNGFCWDDNKPSIFVSDSRFIPYGKLRQSASIIASSVVTRKTERDGKSPGTISGLSKKADSILKDRWGGSVSKAGRL